MKITKTQLRRIIREEYSRVLNELGPSYGGPMVKSWNPDEMPSFGAMQDSALDLLEDLLDGGSVLIPQQDSQALMDFVNDMVADGEEDFESFQPLIQRDNAGENDRWSMT